METFPKKGISKDLYLNELNAIDQKIVYKHLRLSGQIRMYENIRNHLIDQIHKNKSIKKKVRYHPQGLVSKYYDKYMFENKSEIVMGTPLILLLRSELENTMVSELSTKNFNYIPIYYAVEEKP